MVHLRHRSGQGTRLKELPLLSPPLLSSLLFIVVIISTILFSPHSLSPGLLQIHYIITSCMSLSFSFPTLTLLASIGTCYSFLFSVSSIALRTHTHTHTLFFSFSVSVYDNAWLPPPSSAPFRRSRRKQQNVVLSYSNATREDKFRSAMGAGYVQSARPMSNSFVRSFHPSIHPSILPSLLLFHYYNSSPSSSSLRESLLPLPLSLSLSLLWETTDQAGQAHDIKALISFPPQVGVYAPCFFFRSFVRSCHLPTLWIGC